jgi:hypothetical protein
MQRILGRGVRPDVAAGRAFLLPNSHETCPYETCPSVALPHRLATVHEAVILTSAGMLMRSKLADLVERVCAVIRAGGDV